jgi:hypothetical protein
MEYVNHRVNSSFLIYFQRWVEKNFNLWFINQAKILKKSFLITCISSVLAFAEQALASCVINSVVAQSPILSVTDPFSTNDVYVPFNVTIHGGAGGCSGGSLVVSRPSVGSPALNHAVVYISPDSSVGNAYIASNSNFSEATVDNNLNIASNTNDSRTFYAIYHSNISSIVSKGNFPLNSSFEVRDSNSAYVASGGSVVTADVASLASLTVSATTGDFSSGANNLNVNLGNLSQGQQHAFYALVQSSNSYYFNIASSHNFVLQGMNPASGIFGNTVSYTLSIDGNPIAFSGGSVTVTPDNANNGATTVTGRSHEMIMTIGTTSNKVSGTYSDTLTITVTPSSS